MTLFSLDYLQPPFSLKIRPVLISSGAIAMLLFIQTDVKPGRFYILPKIHKTGNSGRPIVSSNSHPTERISQFVDYHINPLVSSLDSHIKDTTDFLNKLSNLGTLPSNAMLVTLDVSSLYTNIPHNEGIDACRHFLGTRTDKQMFRSMVLLWALRWLLHLLTFFSAFSKLTLSLIPLSMFIPGGDFSMMFL